MFKSVVEKDKTTKHKKKKAWNDEFVVVNNFGLHTMMLVQSFGPDFEQQKEKLERMKGWVG